MREPRSIEEKLGIALSNGRIGYKDTYTDLDVVMALGMAVAGLEDGSVSVRMLGENAISRSLASSLLTYWLIGERAQDAHYAAERIVRTIDARNGRRGATRVRDVAHEVLWFWTNEECWSCHGVKWELIEGTPTLSDKPCAACHGSGKRERPWLSRETHMPARKPGQTDKERAEEWERSKRLARDQARRSDQLLVKLDEIVREVARAAGERLR